MCLIFAFLYRRFKCPLRQQFYLAAPDKLFSFFRLYKHLLADLHGLRCLVDFFPLCLRSLDLSDRKRDCLQSAGITLIESRQCKWLRIICATKLSIHIKVSVSATS